MAFFLKTSGSKVGALLLLLYLSEDGHFVFTCNLRAMFRILSVTCSLTGYARVKRSSA